MNDGSRIHPSSLCPYPLFVPLTHDLGSQRIEPLLNALVSAIDLMDVVDRALTLGAERGQEQRHSGADVGTGDLGADEPIAPHDNGAVRIAQDDPRPHRSELVGEKE